MSHNTLLYIYGKRARNFWGAILILSHFNFLYDDLRAPVRYDCSRLSATGLVDYLSSILLVE